MFSCALLQLRFRLPHGPFMQTGHSLTFHIFNCALPSAARDGIGPCRVVFTRLFADAQKGQLASHFGTDLFSDPLAVSLGRVDDTLSQLGRYRTRR
jgi:hypothetical protein